MPRIDSCMNCGKEIVSRHLQRKRTFCCKQCRAEYGIKQRTKICEWCGGSFLAEHPGAPQKFCSKECLAESRRIHPNQFTCEYCGKAFTSNYGARGSRFCSRECARKSGRKAVTCLHCGKTFETLKNRTAKFCSQTCSNRYYRYRKLGNDTDVSTKKSVFTCKWCKKEFEDWTYRNPSFCSAHCRSEYGARQPKPNARRPESFVTQNCEICGTPYTVHKHMIEQRNSKYCSRQCMSEAASRRMMGDNNPNYIDGASPRNYGPDWDRQKRKARKRDNDTCQMCHVVEDYHNGIIIDVHHKIPLRLFDGDYKKANRLSNLICLCRRCHMKEEARLRKEYAS